MRKIIKKEVKAPEVKAPVPEIKETHSICETNELIKQGYIVVEVKSRPKTWVLRKEN